MTEDGEKSSSAGKRQSEMRWEKREEESLEDL